MKPAVHYASKNTVFVEMLHKEKYLVSMMLNLIYSTYNLKKMCTGRTLQTRNQVKYTTAMSLDYTGKACIMKKEVWSPSSHQ
jgi:hypothetical protein